MPLKSVGQTRGQGGGWGAFPPSQEDLFPDKSHLAKERSLVGKGGGGEEEEEEEGRLFWILKASLKDEACCCCCCYRADLSLNVLHAIDWKTITC